MKTVIDLMWKLKGINTPKMLSCAIHKAAAIGLSAVALSIFASPARASLVLNGDFESIVNGAGGVGEFNRANFTTISDWASSGYNFLFLSGSADTLGAAGEFGNLKLWGPNDGSANGLPAASPSGGNYVAADGAFQIGAISQLVNGLTIGNSYIVSFNWAAAQQKGFDGATTERWQVSFGGQTQSTAIANNASHGFTGWMSQAFTFTADNTSDLLSFLSVGTPNGVPPFALLDGVSVDAAAVPEPGSLALMLGGLGLVGLAALRSKTRVKT